jgi:hypothetical protein
MSANYDISGLEVDESGTPIYLHSRDCPGYCDYACNTPQGEQVAVALEARDKTIAQLEAETITWRRIAERNHRANLMPCPKCGHKQVKIHAHDVKP